MSPREILIQARNAAGLTQTALAQRLGTTQSAVARLESPTANPRVATLERALRACDHQLEFHARPVRSSIDETLVFENLRISPGERIKRFETAYAGIREIALAGRSARGELA